MHIQIATLLKMIQNSWSRSDSSETYEILSFCYVLFVDNIGSLQDPTVVLEGTPSLLKFVSDQSDLDDLNKKLKNQSNPLLNLSDLQELVKSIHGNNVGAELRGQELDEALKEMVEKGETFTDLTDGIWIYNSVCTVLPSYKNTAQ